MRASSATLKRVYRTKFQGMAREGQKGFCIPGQSPTAMLQRSQPLLSLANSVEREGTNIWASSFYITTLRILSFKWRVNGGGGDERKNEGTCHSKTFQSFQDKMQMCQRISDRNWAYLQFCKMNKEISQISMRFISFTNYAAPPTILDTVGNFQLTGKNIVLGLSSRCLRK